jgi:hypothetical protein
MIVVFTIPQDVIPVFAKMPIFGFLIILSVWMGNLTWFPPKGGGNNAKEFKNEELS